MTLFDYYLKYMSEICQGSRPAPKGITLTESDEMARAMELQQQITSIPLFVAQCANEDDIEIPGELFDNFSLEDALANYIQLTADEPEQPAQEDDPDAGKHAFEVFLDCIALDDGLVQYLMEVLKKKDRTEFYKLSQITTKMDLDPEEFLYWLGHREDYASDEERACAAIMDGCMERLYREKKPEVLAALLSGDKATFESFRCEAPELVHLPAATYEWYCRNYLDRDYPIRVLMKLNGVEFPE
ncbi:MAG: hypothetical protein KBS74_01200 [Clostridiales bacterium]|nr:hypothetical protein [Candidatus Cacconaster stercorequi]